MPATWEMYGVDANDDGRKDPYNPVDAICAAARYLNAPPAAPSDLRTAIFAYNHADWYVDEVLLYANQYGKLPETLVSSLTGLTEGAHFPVAANARYADDISERRALERSKPGKRAARQRRRGDLELDHTSRDQHLRPRGRAGGRGQRRRRHRDRQVEEARPLPGAPGHLRQPLHLRRARRGLRGLSGAEARTSSPPRTSSSSPPDDEAPDRAGERRHPGRRPRPRRDGELDERREADTRDEPRRGGASAPSPVEHRGRARAPLRLPGAQGTTRSAPGSPASSTRCSRRGCPATSSSRATSPT